MSDDRRHRLGAQGEQLAAEHLQRLGYEIVARNHRTRWGELDLIAIRDGVLVFCEVKTRRENGAAGTPLEALNTDKRRRIRRLVGAWLAERAREPPGPPARAIRCDVIGITLDRAGRLVALEHVEAAF